MTLRVFVEQSRITMAILKNRRVVDSRVFSYYHDLGEVLITTLDKLLKRNNIDTSVIKSFKIQGNTGKDSTSHKIAAAFIEGLKTRV
jgi:hypothetical protein